MKKMCERNPKPLNPFDKQHHENKTTVFLLKIRRKINNFKFSRRNNWRLKCKFATGKPRCRIIGSAIRVRVVSSHSVAPSFT